MLDTKKFQTACKKARDITATTLFPTEVRDYGWVVHPFKKVILVDAHSCMISIVHDGVKPNWKTGHIQWDAMLSGWFVNQMSEAWMNSVDEADITILFNRDLLACGNQVMSQKEIYELLIDSFKIVDENEYELRLLMNC